MNSSPYCCPDAVPLEVLPSYCSVNSRRSENTRSFPNSRAEGSTDRRAGGGGGRTRACGGRGPPRSTLSEDASPETQPHRIPREEQLREGPEGVAEAPRTRTLWRARGQHTAVGGGAEPTWGRRCLCLLEAPHWRHLWPAEGAAGAEPEAGAHGLPRDRRTGPGHSPVPCHQKSHSRSSRQEPSGTKHSPKGSEASGKPHSVLRQGRLCPGGTQPLSLS